MKVRFLGKEEPMVVFSIKAWTQIDAAVGHCKEEVSWLGFAERRGPHFWISEIIIPKQKVSSSTTEQDPEDLAMIYTKMIEDGVNTNTILYHGHSHHNMGVSPSPQDEKEFFGFDHELPFFVRTIHNKKGHCRADVVDREKGILLEDLSTRIDYAFDTEIRDAVIIEIDEKVSNFPRQVYQHDHQYGVWQGHGKGNQWNKSQQKGVQGKKGTRAHQQGSTGQALTQQGFVRTEHGTWVKKNIDDSSDAAYDYMFLRYLVYDTKTEQYRIVLEYSEMKNHETIKCVLRDGAWGNERTVVANDLSQFKVVDSILDAPDGFKAVSTVEDLLIEESFI